MTGAKYRVRRHGFDWDQTGAACSNSLAVEITSHLQRPFSRNLFTVNYSFLYGPRSVSHYLSLFYFVTICYWENILGVAWYVVADVSETRSLHLKFLHWVLTTGNVMGGNISENILRLCSGFVSSRVFILLLWRYTQATALALQSSVSRHLYSLPTFSSSYTSTSSYHLCPLHLTTFVWAFQLSTLSYVSFRCYLGTLSSFILITMASHWNLLNLIFLVGSIYLYKLQISWLYLFPHRLFTNAGPQIFLRIVFSNAGNFYYLFIYIYLFAICDNVRASSLIVRRT